MVESQGLAPMLQDEGLDVEVVELAGKCWWSWRRNCYRIMWRLEGRVVSCGVICWAARFHGAERFESDAWKKKKRDSVMVGDAMS